MSRGNLITPEVNDPYFDIMFINSHRHPQVVWLRFDAGWWTTPNIPSGVRSDYIPALEGATVSWRAVSANAIAIFNLLHGTNWTTQDQEVLNDDLIGWQGEYVVTYGMLGRTAHVELF